MFQTIPYEGTKEEQYETLVRQLDALLEGETDTIAHLANASALLGQFLPSINWVGFYRWDTSSNELVLGPFQGLPACVRIPKGRGVCGTVIETMTTERVQDVHAFPGHIACDTASRSEIVLPIRKNGKPFGVLDIDSPVLDRFDAVDERGLTAFVTQLEHHLQSSN